MTASHHYDSMLLTPGVGVCLHTSSSGLDLPMKVLDMLGSRVPVCAYRYPAIGELVEHEHNGCVFGSSEELKEQIMRLLITTDGGAVDAVASVGNEEMHQMSTQPSSDPSLHPSQLSVPLK